VKNGACKSLPVAEADPKNYIAHLCYKDIRKHSLEISLSDRQDGAEDKDRAAGPEKLYRQSCRGLKVLDVEKAGGEDASSRQDQPAQESVCQEEWVVIVLLRKV